MNSTSTSPPLATSSIGGTLDPIVGVRVACEVDHRAVEVAVVLGAGRSVFEAEVALLGKLGLDVVVVLLRWTVGAFGHVEVHHELVLLLFGHEVIIAGM